jgi:HEPN domain-containing protein
MVDIEKQITCWRNGALEDWDAAQLLIKGGHVRFAFFAVHLAIEKALKALVCRHTNELAPKDHNLLRLAENAGLVLSPKQRRALHAINAYNIKGRYPGSLPVLFRGAETARRIARAEEVFRWLIEQ